MGNTYSLATETGHYLRRVLTLLDAPDIKKAFDANTKWNVVEIVSQRRCQSNGLVDMQCDRRVACSDLCRGSAPLSEGSRTSILDLSRDEMTLLIELVVDLGVN